MSGDPSSDGRKVAGNLGRAVQRHNGRIGADGDDPEGRIDIAVVVAGAPVVALALHSVLGARLLCRGTGEVVDLVQGDLPGLGIDRPDEAVDIPVEIGRG